MGGGELTDTAMPPLALDLLFSKSGCCCRSFPSLPSLYLCLPFLFPTYLKSVHYLFFTSECNVLIIKQVVNLEHIWQPLQLVSTTRIVRVRRCLQNLRLPAMITSLLEHIRSNLRMEFNLWYVDQKHHLANTDNRTPNVTREMLNVNVGATRSSANPNQL